MTENRIIMKGSVCIILEVQAQVNLTITSYIILPIILYFCSISFSSPTSNSYLNPIHSPGKSQKLFFLLVILIYPSSSQTV